MIEDSLVFQAYRTHGIRTRGFVLDVMPMVRRMKKIEKRMKVAGMLEEKCKKKKPRGK